MLEARARRVAGVLRTHCGRGRNMQRVLAEHVGSKDETRDGDENPYNWVLYQRLQAPYLCKNKKRHETETRVQEHRGGNAAHPSLYEGKGKPPGQPHPV